MLRILALGSTLALFASACFVSPPALEAEDGGHHPAGTSSGTTAGSSSGGGSSSTGGSASASSGSSGSSGGRCSIPPPGSCSADSDCAVAFCGDQSCNCGGTAIAKFQLAENPCLVEVGNSVPEVCLAERMGPVCDCPAFAPCTAQCLSGSCACTFICDSNRTACDRLCVDTSSDDTNCGRCDHRCDSGQVCTNGVCS